MNYVAIVAFTMNVNVLAFILMSNHVHFVVECDPLKIEDGSLHRAIAYVQMNSVAANICPYPNMYSWGTGGVFFNPEEVRGTSLGTSSKRAQYELLHSRVDLPPEYKVGPDGYILPQSYVPVGFVEQLYCSARRYQYYLTNSSKASKHLEKNAAPSFEDHVILAACRNLVYTLFRAKRIEELSDEQLKELLRQLQWRFSADINQLCRITGITYENAVKMMDGI